MKFFDELFKYQLFSRRLSCNPLVTLLAFNPLTHEADPNILCFVDRASRYINLKKNQLDAQFIFSTFRQTPLHVSGVSKTYHREVRRMDTTIGTYCCIHTVYLPMMVLVSPKHIEMFDEIY